MTPEPDTTAAIEQTAQALAKQPRTVRELLQGDEFHRALKAILPQFMRADRVIRIALNAMMRTPELADCTRESLFLALLTCSMYGLEPDGRRAHLIPFKNRKNGVLEVQLIIDYKGLAELVLRSGTVSYIHADAVYAGDDFDVVYGSGAHLTHRPGETRGEGKAKKFYAFVRLKDGAEKFDVMTLTEVEKIRKRSKTPDSGPWVTDFNEMGKKTVFRRLSKWLPLSPEVRDAIERDDPDALDVSGAWNEVMTLPEGEKRPTAKDKILAAEATEPAQPATPATSNT
jgi:recombination protein RecT